MFLANHCIAHLCIEPMERETEREVGRYLCARDHANRLCIVPILLYREREREKARQRERENIKTNKLISVS